MNIREIINEELSSIAVENAYQLVEVLSDTTPVFETGLDSLGFAILVIRLEDRLGYDPFVLMDEPVYPKTIGEFVVIYQRFSQYCKGN